MDENSKTQLGKILLKQKLVGRSDLDTLLNEQRDNPEERLASKAIARGFLDEHRALKALSEQHGVPAINLDEVEIELSHLDLVPRDIAAKHLILPTSVSDDTINLAMANPGDRRVMDEIEFVSGKRVFPHVVLCSQLTECIESCYEAQIAGEKIFRGKHFGQSLQTDKQQLNSSPTTNDGTIIADAAPTDVEFFIDVDIPIDDMTPLEPSLVPGHPSAAESNPRTPTFEPKPAAVAPTTVASRDSSVAPRKPTKMSSESRAAGPLRTPSAPSRVSTVAQPAAPEALSRQSLQAKGVIEGQRNATEFPSGAAGVSKPSTGAPKKSSQISGARILVVDDEDDIRMLISRVLADKGYRVVTASRGLEAIQKVQTERPDMIILDAMLPEVHGFDICKKIKGSSKYGHIPVIMISAIYRGWRYAQDLKDSYGVDDFVEKPFKISELVEKVEKYSQKSSSAMATRTEELSKEAERTLAAGIEAYRNGNIDEAVDLLRKGVSIDPLAFKLHYHLALLLGKKGMSYQAIRSLESALELAPDYFPALKNLAVLYQKAGFKFKAIETWERALGHCPEEETREGIKRHLMSLL